jgi:hypothetical protein
VSAREGYRDNKKYRDEGTGITDGTGIGIGIGKCIVGTQKK